MVNPKPLLTPHLKTPKDIATANGEDKYGMQLYHCAKFHADRLPRERVTADLTSDQNAH